MKSTKAMTMLSARLPAASASRLTMNQSTCVSTLKEKVNTAMTALRSGLMKSTETNIANAGTLIRSRPVSLAAPVAVELSGNCKQDVETSEE